MKTYLLLLLFVFMGSESHLFATSSSKKDCSQYLTGDLSLEFSKEVRLKHQALPEETKQLRRIVQKEGFEAATYNQDLLLEHENRYTVEVPIGSITNQKQSGRCWIFASLNMLRSDLIAQKKVEKDFSFSQNYLHFFNMLEKSNHELERLIRYRNLDEKKWLQHQKKFLSELNIGDGGTFPWFLFLVSKYGLVPKNVMPETLSSEATSTLKKELSYHIKKVSGELLSLHKEMRAELPVGQKLSKEQLSRLRERKLAGLHEISQILITHLGLPPQQFKFRLKNEESLFFTPESFAKDFLKFNPQDYVFVSNNPLRDLNKVYEEKNSTIGVPTKGKPSYPYRTLNIDLKRFEDLILKSLDAGEPLYFSADASKDMDRQTGIMHPDLLNRNLVYGFKSGALDLSRRDQMFLHTTGPNHAMAIVGYDRSQDEVVKYKVENSWGGRQGTKEVGDNGIFHMYRPWLEKHVFQYAIHRKFLSEEEQKLWDGQAQILGSSENYYE